MAGDARLRHFEECIADPVSIADANLSVGESLDREVFAELAEDEIIAAEKAFPVAIGVRLINENSPMLPTVAGKVCLRIAHDIQLANHSPSFDRGFPNCRSHGLAARYYIARQTHIYGKQSGHPSLIERGLIDAQRLLHRIALVPDESIESCEPVRPFGRKCVDALRRHPVDIVIENCPRIPGIQGIQCFTYLRRGQRCRGGLLDIPIELGLNLDVLACADTRDVASDNGIPIHLANVFDPGEGLDNILGDRESPPWYPAGEHVIYDHQYTLFWRVDEDVARHMSRTVVGQFQRLVSRVQYVFVLECDSGQRAFGIRVAFKQSKRLVMRDDYRDIAQRFCAADVVGVRMAVDQMRNRLVRDFRDALPDVRREGLRCIHYHYTAVVNEEHGLNLVIRDHVKTAPEALQAVAFGGVDGRSLRR